MTNEFAKPSSAVSMRMRSVKSRGTSLERKMEHILRDLRINYQRQPDILGHPDFRIKKSKILVFCDSSFWHGRRPEDVGGFSFRRNAVFWSNKLYENRRRDARITRALRGRGWLVLRFWDTDILRRSNVVENRLRRHLNLSA